MQRRGTGRKNARARATLFTDAEIIRSANSLGGETHPEKCPDCGHEYLVERLRKDGTVIACPNKECDYERTLEGTIADVSKV